MTAIDDATTIAPLPAPSKARDRVPAVLTSLVWLGFLASVALLAVRGRSGQAWELAALLRIDGLTVVMWVAVTFVSGVVHSFSRRYMDGSKVQGQFFRRIFGFTLVVGLLIAADNLAVFTTAWLLMGLLMAALIGSADGWPQAQAAGALARRYFLASTAVLAGGLALLWSQTGATSVSDTVGTLSTVDPTVLAVAGGALVVAAMIQSSLLPFHTWLFASMTAPTPASALMHAGFVNAGGILLTRFAPVVTVEPTLLLAVAVLGTASAIGGKLIKTVQPDVKSTLASSTVGQMGFMIMQAGLGFFGAAITHLILHGFYKAYRFLSAGGQIDHQTPPAGGAGERGCLGGLVVAVMTGAAGMVLFAVLTGKGTALDSGLILALLVGLTVVNAAREAVASSALPTALRYGAVPLIALPAIALYAGVYRVVTALIADLPAVGYTAALTPAHGLVATVFVLAYLVIDSGVYTRSSRLYVTLLNAAQPPTNTLQTTTEEYNEY
jgi:NAD(P)H-quinone oxidoreductase subunit 5